MGLFCVTEQITIARDNTFNGLSKKNSSYIMNIIQLECNKNNTVGYAHWHIKVKASQCLKCISFSHIKFSPGLLNVRVYWANEDVIILDHENRLVHK